VTEPAHCRRLYGTVAFQFVKERLGEVGLFDEQSPLSVVVLDEPRGDEDVLLVWFLWLI
jgi:hypothetical protein